MSSLTPFFYFVYFNCVELEGQFFGLGISEQGATFCVESRGDESGMREANAQRPAGGGSYFGRSESNFPPYRSHMRTSFRSFVSCGTVIQYNICMIRTIRFKRSTRSLSSKRYLLAVKCCSLVTFQ